MSFHHKKKKKSIVIRKMAWGCTLNEFLSSIEDSKHYE
jgi:hypothetical protein